MSDPSQTPSPTTVFVVLIVDDEHMVRVQHEAICSIIEPEGSVKAVSVATIAAALKALQETEFNVILLDKNIGQDDSIPSQSGIRYIGEIKRLQPHIEIIMITGSADTTDIVEAMQRGASNYIVKGTDANLIAEQIKRSINISELKLKELRAAAMRPEGERELLAGSSLAMRQLRNQLEAVAATDSAVLLLGETGTGKSESAKYLNWFRQEELQEIDRPFVALNMAGLPLELAEAELFGNDPGAFTDAKKLRIGKFEAAHNGTLFLDEIGETPLEIQAKLLTVLDSKTFSRLGSNKVLKSNFKLVCATNRDLKKMVDEKTFREDLYRRIARFPVQLPPLSERREDIPDIVRAMLPFVCAETHVYVNFEEIPRDFLEHLMKMGRIDGNIRGVETYLSWLLVFSERDRKKRPILSDWREKILAKMEGRSTQSASGEPVVTLDLLLNGTYDVVGSKFPGLNKVLSRVTYKIIKDAIEKHPKRLDQAVALGLSRVHYINKVGQLGIESRRTAKAPRKKK